MKRIPAEFIVEKKCAICRMPVFYDGFTYEGYNTFDGLRFYCEKHWGEDGRLALAHEEGPDDEGG